jgi:hypothetical protein
LSDLRCFGLLRLDFGSRDRYTKSSVLVGKAKSFKPMHDYPSSTFEKFDETESSLLSECPCVALTASDGRGFQNSCGEGYTSLGTIWGLRDVIFECQNCQHDTKNGLLQNRVVQNGARYALKPTTAPPIRLAIASQLFPELTRLTVVGQASRNTSRSSRPARLAGACAASMKSLRAPSSALTKEKS